MRVLARLRMSACMAALLGTGLSAGMGVAFAQPAGYVILNTAGENAPDRVKTSSVQGPEAFPSIQEIPDASAVAADGPQEKPAARPMTEAEKHIRVVGPKFFPDPGEALDLRVPGRIHVQ